MALPEEILFVDENYIKRYTWINGSVDPLLMYPAIYLAQDEHIQQIIGTDLYVLIKGLIETGDITEPEYTNYKHLLDNYLRKTTCWWSLYEMLPHLYIKTDNGSLVIRRSENTEPIGTDDYMNYREQARQKALYYSQIMINFICKNRQDYPEFNTNSQGQFWSNPTIFPSNNFEISRSKKDKVYGMEWYSLRNWLNG
jgi:hypothetical protein